MIAADSIRRGKKRTAAGILVHHDGYLRLHGWLGVTRRNVTSPRRAYSAWVIQVRPLALARPTTTNAYYDTALIDIRSSEVAPCSTDDELSVGASDNEYAAEVKWCLTRRS